MFCRFCGFLQRGRWDSYTLAGEANTAKIDNLATCIQYLKHNFADALYCVIYHCSLWFIVYLIVNNLSNYVAIYNNQMKEMFLIDGIVYLSPVY